ncbi:MAG: hypothetical protein AAGG08_02205 [Actinomycetota bacterium]
MAGSDTSDTSGTTPATKVVGAGAGAGAAGAGANEHDRIVTVLDPEDEYPHVPDEAENYNESMYLNAFDLEQEIGGWFRLGNRVNEGYAEMSVCLYLPGGRVGFMFDRPKITTNERMSAGGLTIEVVEPFEHLTVSFDGRVCVLDDPSEMNDPRTAFRENPIVDCSVRLEFRGVSPMYGGRPQYADGREIEVEPGTSFAKAHYEQHCSVTGTIEVAASSEGGAGDSLVIDGLGLRDKSWGPRYWQALTWYRWLPMVFGPDFAMMISVIDRGEGKPPRQGGMVLVGDEYHQIRECSVDAEWNERGEQSAMRCRATTDHAEYDVTGEVISMIPLRNRRTTPDGEQLFTRITEAMTRFECDGRTGIGMSEFLDQVVDGWPIGVPQG